MSFDYMDDSVVTCANDCMNIEPPVVEVDEEDAQAVEAEAERQALYAKIYTAAGPVSKVCAAFNAMKPDHEAGLLDDGLKTLLARCSYLIMTARFHGLEAQAYPLHMQLVSELSQG